MSIKAFSPWSGRTGNHLSNCLVVSVMQELFCAYWQLGSKLNFVTQVSSMFRIADVCSENLQCLPERLYMILAQLVLNFKPKSDVL